MPCLAISASTTAYGRAMIMHTRELVQRTYTRANGYEADCEVIYGDTDSVMVNFKVRLLVWCVNVVCVNTCAGTDVQACCVHKLAILSGNHWHAMMGNRRRASIGRGG